MRKRFIVAIIVSLVVVLPMSFVVGAIAVAQRFGIASPLSYRSLDYDVRVVGNGDLEVTQTIDVRMTERKDDNGKVRPWKQLYQQYRLKSSNLTGISDISVKNITEGIDYEESAKSAIPDVYSDSEWNAEQANHWYIAKVNGGATTSYEVGDGEVSLPQGVQGDDEQTVELGWNIPATASADSMRFRIRFTMHDVATAWDDVATFQWEPFGKENQVPIGTVTGTVRFPAGVGKTDSWAWLHTERESTTTRTAGGGLEFTVHDVRSGDYLDLVAAYDVHKTRNIARTRSGDRLDALKHSEDEQRRQWEENKRNAARARLIYWTITLIMGVILCAWAIIAVVSSHLRSRYRGPIEYWRDKPSASPAAAARLIGIVDHGKGGGGGRAPAMSRSNRELTATMLSLAVKKAIAIFPGPASMYYGIDLSEAAPASLSRFVAADPGRRRAAGTTSTIVVMPQSIDRIPNTTQMGLTQSENALLDLLIVISQRVGCPVFDLNQMREACRDWKDGYIELGRFTDACDTEYRRLGASKSVSWQWILSGVLAAVLGFVTLLANAIIGYSAVGLLLGLPALTIGLFCSMTGATHVITRQGQETAGQCLGLKRYMEDFSDFTDRGAADLALWDWYMVYAAAFGISDKVKRELAKAYPEVTDPEWLDRNASDSTFYWDYRADRWRDERYDEPHGTMRVGGVSVGSGPVQAFGGGFHGIGPNAVQNGGGPGFGLGDLGSQLSAGMSDITSTIHEAAPVSSDSGSDWSSSSSGSFSGGGFGGSSGGSGGGSFGGR
ncbi:DUF2207 domain-containing protein [Bifidobacterium platyrrhinorum]|uniref:DUF2207 domain-containing protein n=1 Tax=Bifidobacterium platyrrhinorum TaxID=2661628 RepID=A0A6L9SR70_9BIFI|nr:DUF2207 domain-containing protein [Bifidobacterium platyrrhinorum]NEG54984.1 DUF2207 domain-containing protein [Bifidobacterium platyrrhinorum]